MANWLVGASIFIVILFIGQTYGAPVNPEPHIPDVKEGTDPTDENFLALEYKKYLQEVVEVLESDEQFKAEVDKLGDDADLANGQIAHYLQFANKNTRTKLDELKRLELRRLKDLHKKLMREAADDIRNGKKPDGELPSVDLEHMDHSNPHSFEIDDLKKLVKKTTDDLTNLDKKRKEEFKKYEMNKEHEYREKLSHAEKEEAEKLKKEHEEQQKRHNDHEKLNHPGSKKQLEEVWEEEDHMDPENFDPKGSKKQLEEVWEDDGLKSEAFDHKAFFMMHDLDGDGFWSVPEVEALFQKELDKVYNSSNPDDDMVEREEEMNRMREHVFNEIDTDKDQFVSMEEFLQSTKTEEFENEENWDTLEGEEPFNEEEYAEYEKAIKEAEEKMKSGQDNGNHGDGNQAPPQPAEHKNE